MGEIEKNPPSKASMQPNSTSSTSPSPPELMTLKARLNALRRRGLDIETSKNVLELPLATKPPLPSLPPPSLPKDSFRSKNLSVKNVLNNSGAVDAPPCDVTPPPVNVAKNLPEDLLSRAATHILEIKPFRSSVFKTDTLCLVPTNPSSAAPLSGTRKVEAARVIDYEVSPSSLIPLSQYLNVMNTCTGPSMISIYKKLGDFDANVGKMNPTSGSQAGIKSQGSFLNAHLRRHQSNSKIQSNANTSGQNVSGKTRASTSTVPCHFEFEFKASIALLCGVGEKAELFFSIYNKTEQKYISEDYVIELTYNGMPKDEEKIGQLKTLFTGLTSRELGESLFLVCRIVRRGRMTASTDREILASMIFKESSSLNANGSTLASPSATSSASSKSLSVRRPFGCSVLDLAPIISHFYDVPDTSSFLQLPLEFTMKIYTSFSDSVFSQFHEHLISKNWNEHASNNSNGMTISGSANQNSLGSGKVENLVVAVRAISATETSPLAPSPSCLSKRNTERMGFPEVIMPGDVRNQVYLTLVSGDFVQGRKTSAKNVEVSVQVRLGNGQLLENAIFLGTGTQKQSRFDSLVFYHNNNPKWNETIRLDIPVNLFDHGVHIFFSFRHCSTNEKFSLSQGVSPDAQSNSQMHSTLNLSAGELTSEKCFAFSVMPLMLNDDTVVRDGLHSLTLFKFDRKSVLPEVYLPHLVSNATRRKSHGSSVHHHSSHESNLQQHKNSFELNSGQDSGNLSPPLNSYGGRDHYRSSAKDHHLNPLVANGRLSMIRDQLMVRTAFCSTKLTQNVSLLKLLRWQELDGVALQSVLNNFTFIGPVEIIKYVRDIFDALFSIMGASLECAALEGEVLRSVFSALTFVLNIILADRRFINFRSILDAYLLHHFHQHPHVASVWKVLSSLMLELAGNPQDPLMGKELRSSIKAWEYLFKFIVGSWRRCPLNSSNGEKLDLTGHPENQFNFSAPSTDSLALNPPSSPSSTRPLHRLEKPSQNHDDFAHSMTLLFSTLSHHILSATPPLYFSENSSPDGLGNAHVEEGRVQPLSEKFVSLAPLMKENVLRPAPLIGTQILILCHLHFALEELASTHVFAVTWLSKIASQFMLMTSDDPKTDHSAPSTTSTQRKIQDRQLQMCQNLLGTRLFHANTTSREILLSAMVEVIRRDLAVPEVLILNSRLISPSLQLLLSIFNEFDGGDATVASMHMSELEDAGLLSLLDFLISAYFAHSKCSVVAVDGDEETDVPCAPSLSPHQPTPASSAHHDTPTSRQHPFDSISHQYATELVLIIFSLIHHSSPTSFCLYLKNKGANEVVAFSIRFFSMLMHALNHSLSHEASLNVLSGSTEWLSTAFDLHQTIFKILAVSAELLLEVTVLDHQPLDSDTDAKSASVFFWNLYFQLFAVAGGHLDAAVIALAPIPPPPPPPYFEGVDGAEVTPRPAKILKASCPLASTEHSTDSPNNSPHLPAPTYPLPHPSSFADSSSHLCPSPTPSVSSDEATSLIGFNFLPVDRIVPAASSSTSHESPSVFNANAQGEAFSQLENNLAQLLQCTWFRLTPLHHRFFLQLPYSCIQISMLSNQPLALVSIKILVSIILQQDSTLRTTTTPLTEVEIECIDAMDRVIMASTTKLREDYQTWFVDSLRTQIDLIANSMEHSRRMEKSVCGAFIESINQFLSLALQVRRISSSALNTSVMSTDILSQSILHPKSSNFDGTEATSSMSEVDVDLLLAELLHFTQLLGREQMYVKYVHQLAATHFLQQNVVEAAFALKHHADLLEWPTLESLHHPPSSSTDNSNDDAMTRRASKRRSIAISTIPCPSQTISFLQQLIFSPAAAASTYSATSPSKNFSRLPLSINASAAKTKSKTLEGLLVPEMLHSLQFTNTSSLRKEILLLVIMELWIREELFELAIRIGEELCRVYGHVFFDYAKLAAMLRVLSTLTSHIHTSSRFYPEYYRVAFVGHGWNQESGIVNLIGKHYVYRSKPWEKLAEFVENFLKQYPGARLLKTNTWPPDSSAVDSKERWLQIAPVEPAADSVQFGEYLSPLVPESIRLWYTRNQIRHFTLSRPFVKPGSDRQQGQNEFVSLWTESFTLTTQHQFPFHLKRNEVVHVERREVSPIENAVLNVERKNHELTELYQKYAPVAERISAHQRKSSVHSLVTAGQHRFDNQSPSSTDASSIHPSSPSHQHPATSGFSFTKLDTSTTPSLITQVNCNPLTMSLNGAVDAPVNGGLPMYRRAFLTSAFLRQHSELEPWIQRLRNVIDTQVTIIQKCIQIHEVIAPVEMKPLHATLVEFFQKNFAADIERIFGTVGGGASHAVNLPA